MIDEELLIRQISPKVILKHTKLEDEGELKISSIYEMYLKTPGLPLLVNYETLFGGIRIGINKGLFGLRSDTGIVLGQSIFDIHGEMDLLGKSKAVSLIPAEDKDEKPVDGKKQKSTGDSKTDKEEKGGAKTDKAQLTKSLVITAKIPWEKLSSIIGGVLAPLKEKDGSIQLKLDIKAITETGFDRTTLDSRVKETLNQIGAEIEIWQED